MPERKMLHEFQVDCACRFQVWQEGEGITAIYPSLHLVHPDCRPHQHLLENPDGVPTKLMGDTCDRRSSGGI